ncbi:MAG: WYL domain-containing protein [Verrucomicrobia bacterium]|nr:WYL domain-containing protein [Verrucomicrobiota bacterium]
MKKVKSALYSRLPWERMLKIHEKIKTGGWPNCVQMAAEMEVGLRTVKRDLDFMRDRLRMPIEYDNRQHGFYYTKLVDNLPSTPMTEAEIFAMLVAHKAIAQYHGTPFERPLQMAFRKMAGMLDREERYSLENLLEALSFRPFAPEDTDLRIFQTITRALQSKRALRFKYRNLGSKAEQERLTHPYHLACIDNQWYLFAFDVRRQGMRTFSLSRLTDPELTGEHYKMPKDFDPDEYLSGSLNVFKGHEDFEVVIEFDSWATDLVRGRQWHASQVFEELPEGGSRMKMRLNSVEKIERRIRNWGVHATVLGPPQLVERIAETTEKLAKRYQGARTVAI